MKATISWTWLAALLLCALVTTPALAQGDPDAGTEAGTEAEAEAEADAGVDEAPTEAASDAKRMVRIRKVIELDTQHLRWLRRELRSRTEWFEGLVEAMAEVAAERNDKKEKLEALEAAPESDPDEVEALRAELKEIEVDYGLFDTQTDLALTAEKAVREQVAALEEKIEAEKRALGELTGEIEIELPDAPAAAPATTAEPRKAPPLPFPVPVPVSYTHLTLPTVHPVSL